MSRVASSVTRALACSADTRILPVPLPVSLVVSPPAARALARPVCPSFPAAAGLGALPVSLPPSLGAAARANVLSVPLPVPCAVPCVPQSAARALARPVCLSSPAAAGPGALPVSLPPLLAACALVRLLPPSPGAPSVPFHPSPRVPAPGTLLHLFAVSPLLDHAPGARCRCSCGSVMPGGVRLGARGRAGPGPRQPPLLALRKGFPRARQRDRAAGAGPAVVAVVLLGGAIGVLHHCYPRRHAWFQACPSHYLLVHQWRAVGSAVWCCVGGEGGGGWRWLWSRVVRNRRPSTGTGTGGG